ncbi:hypothetical protein QAD02_012857 [Eretmocerus hayati]|uniref:Uncharacterized protein n=1 Tax=Eretmocerus hayati TaxID=131215 RepID=A0ACC2P5M7_9HYME|nr:hypothetical protein QAD02_012857 [Eretmocerus hayati]
MSAVDDLLKLFRRHPQGIGDLTHYGLERAIIEQLKSIGFFDSMTIYIDIFLDGIPIFKSRNLNLVALLGKIVHPLLKQPFFISGYYGKEKAPNINFMAPFETEYTELEFNGFTLEGRQYIVEVRLVTTDTVARNWVLEHPTHLANQGCEKCIKYGFKVGGDMTFLDLDALLKTDENFRESLPPPFNMKISPLERMRIGPVSRVPIEIMHQGHLGMMKRFLNIWLNMYGGGFARKPRGFDEIKYWKATEYRLFLLYLGVVAIRSLLGHDFIVHFNALNCAMRILSDPDLCISLNSEADNLLRYFVQNVEFLYGREHVVFCVRSAIHLAADVLNFGSVEEYSLYPYESFLGYLKSLIRSSSSPLSPVVKRLTEKNLLPQANEPQQCGAFLADEKSQNDQRKLLEGFQDAHGSINFPNFKMTDTYPNNFCYLVDETIVSIESICHQNGEPVIIAQSAILRQQNSHPNFTFVSPVTLQPTGAPSVLQRSGSAITSATGAQTCLSHQSSITSGALSFNQTRPIMPLTIRRPESTITSGVLAANQMPPIMPPLVRRPDDSAETSTTLHAKQTQPILLTSVSRGGSTSASRAPGPPVSACSLMQSGNTNSFSNGHGQSRGMMPISLEPNIELSDKQVAPQDSSVVSASPTATVISNSIGSDGNQNSMHPPMYEYELELTTEERTSGENIESLSQEQSNLNSDLSPTSNSEMTNNRDPLSQDHEDNHAIADTYMLDADPLVDINSNLTAVDVKDIKSDIVGIKNDLALLRVVVTNILAGVARIEELIRIHPCGQVGGAPAESCKPTVVNLLPHFPLVKKQNLREFSRQLEQNAEMLIQFVSNSSDFILSVGGEGGQRTITNTMSHFMTNKLGKRYNCTGVKGGKKFKDLIVAKVLTTIFVSGGIANQFDTEHAIGDWLRRSGSRKAMYPALENESDGESTNDEDDNPENPEENRRIIQEHQDKNGADAVDDTDEDE